MVPYPLSPKNKFFLEKLIMFPTKRPSITATVILFNKICLLLSVVPIHKCFTYEYTKFKRTNMTMIA